MNSTETLDLCETAGVRLWVHEGDLVYRGPESAMTLELVSALKSNKAEIIQVLQGGKDGFEGNAVSTQLLGRVQKGLRWLNEQHEQWLQGSAEAATDERFSAALGHWWEMERSLRLVFEYQGCIREDGCPDTGGVCCDACVESQE